MRGKRTCGGGGGRVTVLLPEFQKRRGRRDVARSHQAGPSMSGQWGRVSRLGKPGWITSEAIAS